MDIKLDVLVYCYHGYVIKAAVPILPMHTKMIL